ncbi:VanZ family protein [bacterium]|nr:VanZ family protein [bacterium]
MRHRLWIYGPAFAYMLLIFILSSIPSLSPPDLGIDAEDKIAHILEYAVLGFLLSRSVLATRKPGPGPILAVFLTGSLYAASDEWHQSFVPNRFASVWDVCADMAGVVLGQMIFYWRYRCQQARIG